MKKSLTFLTSAMFIIATLVSCNTDDNGYDNGGIPAIPVTGITLNQTDTTLSIADTLILTATVLPEDATNRSVIWSSSRSYVASVSNEGVVVARSGGTATITAATQDGNYTADFVVTVSWAPPQLATLRGASNICPMPVAWLFATSENATEFEWFLYGELIEGATGAGLAATATGYYQVRGVNYLDGVRQVGDKSYVLFIEWTLCEPVWIDGAWTGQGECNWTGDIVWDDIILNSNYFGDYDPTLFFTLNAFHRAQRLSFRYDGIFRSGEILHTFPDGTTWRQFRIWKVDGNIVLLSNDMQSPTDVVMLTAIREGETEPFAFRLPPTIQFANGPGTRGGIAIVSFNAAGTPQAFVEAAFDVIFARPGSEEEALLWDWTDGTTATTSEIREARVLEIDARIR